MKMVILHLLVVCSCLGVANAESAPSYDDDNVAKVMTAAGTQDWGYVDVRSGAHMFWWLFETTHSDGAENRPLVMWLQGGPGGSSTGYGNFELIGPVGLDMSPRNTSWAQESSLLFVDNPVGTGYSYVDSDSAYTTTTDEIAYDLLALLDKFLEDHPKFKTVPFYIFGQSYGGKMGAVFASKLHQSIGNGNIECNLEGLAMGNAWISGVDSTISWAPLLLEMGLIGQKGYEKVNNWATLARMKAERGNWDSSTNAWMTTEYWVAKHAAMVSFYNLRRFRKIENHRRGLMDDLEEFGLQLPGAKDSKVLMDGSLRNYLEIIPENVTWGGQSNRVFEEHKTDFMKPVYNTVSDLLEYTDMKIVVYQGQLDVICCTSGALKWVQHMEWSGLEDYHEAIRETLRDPDIGEPEMFVKGHDNFRFYWLLDGGHSVAKDQPETALRLLQHILSSEEDGSS